VAARRALARLAPLSWVLLLAGVLVAAHLQHVSLQPVLTGSMAPTFAAGDAVVVRDRPADDVRVGDVLVVVPPGQPDAFAHRVVAVDTTAGRPVVRTKGDANAVQDDWVVALDEPTVREVQGHVPRLGSALLAVQSPRARGLLLALLGLTCLGAAVRVLLGSVVVLPSSS